MENIKNKAEEDFIEDERKDVELLKEAMERMGTYDEMAKWISSIWKKKYSSEFRGNINLSYDIADETFILKCGDKTLVFEEDDLLSIPKQLTFLRRTQ